MTLELQPEREVYEAAWKDHGLCFTQNWAWGEVKSVTSRPERLLIDDVPVTVLSRKLPGVGGRFGYVPRGFSPELVHKTGTFADIAARLTEELALTHLIIEPDVFGAEAEDANSWQRAGFVIQGETIQPRYSNHLPAIQPGDDLLARMEHDARRRIKQARERDDLTFREDNSEAGLHRFYECLRASTERSKFVAQSESYFRRVYDAFYDSGALHLLFVERENELLYASFALADNALRRLYGAPTPLGRTEPAGHLLLWESVKLAHKLRLDYLDLWGVAPYSADGFDKSHSLYGVSKFKASFGGQNVTYLPQLIWVRDRLRFRTYQAMLKAHRRLLQLRKAF